MTITLNEQNKFVTLQIAVEAFLVNAAGVVIPHEDIVLALLDGNKHASKFALTDATYFAKYWSVLAQEKNTPTGFSGTLFICEKDEPETGAKKGERVMSFTIALRVHAAAIVRSQYGMEHGVRQYHALLGLDKALARLTSLH